MGGELFAEDDVFCMTALDMRAEFLETFANQLAAGEVSLRTADEIYRVEVDCEAFATDGLVDETRPIAVAPINDFFKKLRLNIELFWLGIFGVLP